MPIRTKEESAVVASPDTQKRKRLKQTNLPTMGGFYFKFDYSVGTPTRASTNIQIAFGNLFKTLTNLLGVEISISYFFA